MTSPSAPPTPAKHALAVLLPRDRGGTNPVSFDPLRESFQLGDATLRGLTQQLARAFYPTYRQSASARTRAGHTNRWRGDGARRGSRVDRELTAAANAPARFQRDRAHRFTQGILDFLAHKHLRLVAGQVPLHDARLALATAIDLLAVDTQRGGALVLIEIKCGFEGYCRDGNAPLRGPVPVANSPANQHQLQLLMMREILRRRYRVVVGDAIVVRAHVSQAAGGRNRVVVEKSRLAPWARLRADALYEFFVHALLPARPRRAPAPAATRVAVRVAKRAVREGGGGRGGAKRVRGKV